MTRNTRFRLLARLDRAGLDTRWVPPKGFSYASILSVPLSQAYPGAPFDTLFELFSVFRDTRYHPNWGGFVLTENAPSCLKRSHL